MKISLFTLSITKYSFILEIIHLFNSTDEKDEVIFPASISMVYFSWKNITEMYVSQYISARDTAVK